MRDIHELVMNLLSVRMDYESLSDLTERIRKMDAAALEFDPETLRRIVDAHATRTAEINEIQMQRMWSYIATLIGQQAHASRNLRHR